MNHTKIKNYKTETWGEMVKKDFRRNKMLYLLALPVMAYYICFHYLPMGGAIIAFKNFKPQLGVWGSQWVGFHHFKTFFTSPSFWSILKNTFRISSANLFFTFITPIIFALLLNELKNDKFAKIVQNATYLPHFVSIVVVCGLVRSFTLDNGVITKFLTLFGFEAKSYINFPQYFTTIYVASSVWKEMGWSAIIYLAALQGIDPQLYEAADLDGANCWQRTINVTIPGILPTIVTMLIMAVGGILSLGYEKILLLYNNSTLEVADIISTYVYRKGLTDLQFSFSTAVGLFSSVVNFTFIIAANTISKKINDVGLW